jgi:hypothetical protein
MTIYQELVTDLRSIPDQKYIDFMVECKKIYMKYPGASINNFIKGHLVEHLFVKSVSPYIELESSKKDSPDDPDCVYKKIHLPDVKTKTDGLQTKKNGQFYAREWTLKNPYSSKEVFTTRADSYILIDPTCSKVAVIDSKYFSGLFNNHTSNTCTFKVYKSEVDMIFDGTGKIPIVESIPPISEYDLMEAIFKL